MKILHNEVTKGNDSHGEVRILQSTDKISECSAEHFRVPTLNAKIQLFVFFQALRTFNEMLDILHSALKEFCTKRNTKFSPMLFQHMFERQPVSYIYFNGLLLYAKETTTCVLLYERFCWFFSSKTTELQVMLWRLADDLVEFMNCSNIRIYCKVCRT